MPVNLACVPNWSAQLGVTITTPATTPADMGPENLATPWPSDPCRMLDLKPSVTAVAIDLGEVRPVASAALIAHNLTREATYRLRVSETAIDLPALVPPLSIVTSTNMTGVVGNIDEDPDDPDGDYLEPTVHASAASVTVDFDDQSLSSGADLQQFRVYVAPIGFVGGETVYPEVTISLRQGGTAIRSGAAVPVDFIGTLAFEFDAAELVYSGHVQCRVDVAPTIDDVTVMVGAIGWRAALAATEYDSGWLPVPWAAADAAWDGSEADDVGPETQKNLSVLLDAYEAQYLLWEIRDEANPDSFIQIGVAPCGVRWTPANTNFKKGKLVTFADNSKITYTPDGQAYGPRVAPVRRSELSFGNLTNEEAWEIADRILWRLGPHDGFLVVLFADDPVARRHTTLWVAKDYDGKFEGDVREEKAAAQRELSMKVRELR